MTSGTVGGDSIGFSAVASMPMRGIVVEPKICEWCGAGFCRVVGSGAKECSVCSGRLERLAGQPIQATTRSGRRRRAA